MAMNGEWNKYAEKVLSELKRHEVWLGRLDVNLNNHITEISKSIAEIKVQQKLQSKLYFLFLTTLLGIIVYLFTNGVV